MRIHEMIDSKFLKKEDAGDGILVTIKGVEKRDVGTEAEPEQKWCLLLAECKPLVLNSTNLALIEKALGSDNTDDWTGLQIVLFNDENVSFGGKLTGGVRVDVNRTKRYHAKGQGSANNASAAQYGVASGGGSANMNNPRPAPKAFSDFQDDPPF
jgi:hypothetical protein